jgi:hypothetical protein
MTLKWEILAQTADMVPVRAVTLDNGQGLQARLMY